jgi:flagellin
MQIGNSNLSFLNKTTNDIGKNLNALSSGSKLSSSSINPANLAIVEKMTAQLKGTDEASNNINDGISMLQTAEGGVSQQQQILQDVRELSVRAGNGTLSSSDRDSIGNQVSELMKEYDQITLGSSFNGNSLLDGSTPSIDLQTGPNSGDVSTINLPDTSSATNGVSTIDLSTPAGATAALGSLDTAIDNLSTARAEIGTYQSTMSSKIDNLSQSNVNIAEARSRMADTDYAKTQSELIKNNILSQTQIAMQVHSRNISSQLTMALLK